MPTVTRDSIAAGDHRDLRTPFAAVALVAASFLLLLPSLGDFPVADCFSLLTKARDLSVLQILHPSQTSYINEYYRPAFVLVLKAFQAIAGPAGPLQHVFTAVLHGISAFLVYLLFIELLRERRGALLAALAFLAHPGNIATVTWTTVAYATMAGTFTLLALLALLRYLGTGSVAALVIGGAAVLTAYLSSETPYLLAPALALFVLGFARDRSRVRNRKAGLALIVALLLLTLVHYTLLERQVSAATFNPNQSPLRLPLWFLRTLPRYFAAYAGVNVAALSWPLTVAAWSAIGLAASLIAWRLGRPALFVLGLAVAGTLPYSLIDLTDRYAYFASAPALMLGAHVLLAAADRFGHLAGSCARGLCLLAIAWFARGALGVERGWSELAMDARNVYQGFAQVKPRLARANQLFLVNVPRFDKWIGAYQLGYRAFDAAKGQPATAVVQWHNYFEAAGVRFAPPPADGYPADAILLVHEHGRLIERTPAELKAGKVDYPIASFPRHYVVAREASEAAVSEALAAYPGDRATSSCSNPSQRASAARSSGAAAS
ncbi:MAG: glycosyltransferase family 39 protein [Planctomycetota bacterium]